MIINHNLPGSNAIRQMNVNSANASKSMEKLSSGLRINTAADDAAGLAISEKMRGQIRGLDQASSNAQDGISLIQTAEGALSETTSILQRMRELGVQSATDTNTADDRAKIQSEVDELAKEITRISNTTEFNSQNLLNGGVQSDNVGELTFHVGANSGQNLSLSIKAMDAKTLGVSRDALAGSIGTNSAGLSSVEADNGINATDKLAAGTYKVTVSNVNAGATSSTTASTAGTINAGAVTGKATADTNVTLTYSSGAGIATKDTGSTVTVGEDTVTGTATKATSVTLTYDAQATNNADGDGSQTGGTNGGGSATNAGAALSFTRTGTVATTDAGTYQLKFTDATNFQIWKGGVNTNSVGEVGTAVSIGGVNVEVAAAVGGTYDTATTMEFTIAEDTYTGGWTASGDLAGKVSGATNEVNGMNIDITKLSGAADGDVVTVTGAAEGWIASGDLTGEISGATNAVNGMNIDTTKLSGFNNGETVTVTGTKDASTTVQLFDNSDVPNAIGNAIKIDQANGGTYTVGNTDTGKMSVTFDAGEAKTGTSSVTVSQTASAATAFADGQNSVDASVSGGIDVSTQDAANLAITKIDTAIKTVSSERAKLGAYSNRLEHTIANLGTSSENLTSAESRIRDVDMAKEMATFSKNNILSQAAQAMLAQANQQPQQVLQLLR